MFLEGRALVGAAVRVRRHKAVGLRPNRYDLLCRRFRLSIDLHPRSRLRPRGATGLSSCSRRWGHSKTRLRAIVSLIRALRRWQPGSPVACDRVRRPRRAASTRMSRTATTRPRAGTPPLYSGLRPTGNKTPSACVDRPSVAYLGYSMALISSARRPVAAIPSIKAAFSHRGLPTVEGRPRPTA